MPLMKLSKAYALFDDITGKNLDLNRQPYEFKNEYWNLNAKLIRHNLVSRHPTAEALESTREQLIPDTINNRNEDDDYRRRLLVRYHFRSDNSTRRHHCWRSL